MNRGAIVKTVLLPRVLELERLVLAFAFELGSIFIDVHRLDVLVSDLGPSRGDSSPSEGVQRHTEQHLLELEEDDDHATLR